jgi:hypothetical protein
MRLVVKICMMMLLLNTNLGHVLRMEALWHPSFIRGTMPNLELSRSSVVALPLMHSTTWFARTKRNLVGPLLQRDQADSES